jgi:hypothetical protein
MQEFTIELAGSAPLLMKGNRGINPIDPLVKEMSRAVEKNKKNKTDENFYAMARLEHQLSLNMHHELGPYIPTTAMQMSLVTAGRLSRRGTKVSGAVLITDIPGAPLLYNGPRDVEGLWENEKFRHFAPVTVGGQKIMRCRPIFEDWSCTFHGMLDTTILESEDFEEVVAASQNRGMGDWRPTYGRFQAKLIWT